MENNKTSLVVLIVIIFAVGSFYLYGFTGNNLSNIPYVNIPEPLSDTPQGDSDRMVMNFSKRGYLVMDNPGQTPGVTYLVYEESGSLALTAEIKLTESSSCIFGEGQSIPCLEISAPLSISQDNKLVLVEGYFENGVVSVVTLDTGTTTTPQME